jgi:hypothetical protein
MAIRYLLYIVICHLPASYGNMCRQHSTPFYQLAQLVGVDHTHMVERIVKRRSLVESRLAASHIA